MHFGSKIQNGRSGQGLKNLGVLDTKFVSLVCLTSASGAHMADAAALIRAEEEARVATWCRQQGVANEMNLAFFYLTFDEALRDAGRAVANAWQQARNRSSVGLAVTARPVMALGVPPCSKAVGVSTAEEPA